MAVDDLIDLATTNGSVEVPPSEGEQGTAIEQYDRLFLRFDEGKVYVPDWVTPRKIDEMLARDGKARAIEQALTLTSRAADWMLEPVAGDRGERDFVYDVLTRPANAGGMSTPIELVIAQAVTACLYRRAFFEKVWRYRDDGRLVYDKIAWRPPASCELKYDEKAGSFEGFRQFVGSDKQVHPNVDSEGKVLISPQKAFVYIYGQHRKPITGLSDLDTVYALYEAKQKIKWLWWTFLENQTMPKAVAKHSGTDPNEIKAFAVKVATLKGGGVVGIGPNQSVEPFETSINAGSVFHDAIRYLDSEMSGSVLAGFTDLASGAASGRGSLALSQDQSDFFLQSRQALLRELAASMIAFLIADLVRWNFGIGGAVPRLKFAPLLHENAEKAVELLQNLVAQDHPPVPQEFIDLLVQKVAAYLDIDTDTVAKAIKERQAVSPQDPASQLAAGVHAATAIIARQQAASVDDKALHAP